METAILGRVNQLLDEVCTLCCWLLSLPAAPPRATSKPSTSPCPRPRELTLHAIQRAQGTLTSPEGTWGHTAWADAFLCQPLGRTSRLSYVPRFPSPEAPQASSAGSAPGAQGRWRKAKHARRRGEAGEHCFPLARLLTGPCHSKVRAAWRPRSGKLWPTRPSLLSKVNQFLGLVGLLPPELVSSLWEEGVSCRRGLQARKEPSFAEGGLRIRAL